jgi:hypothetical protein
MIDSDQTTFMIKSFNALKDQIDKSITGSSTSSLLLHLDELKQNIHIIFIILNPADDLRVQLDRVEGYDEIVVHFQQIIDYFDENGQILLILLHILF